MPLDLRDLRYIIGFEDLPPDDEDEDEDDDGSGEPNNEGKAKGGKGQPPADTPGLHSALKKERQTRKTLEKQLKELQDFKEKAENANKTELEQTRDAHTKLSEENTRLKTENQTLQVKFAIHTIATKYRFRDIDDALRLIDGADIDIDEESGVVDPASVEAAVKALAEKKPHLILSEGDEDLPGTGSKFGGPKKKKKDMDDEALRKKYPALRR